MIDGHQRHLEIVGSYATSGNSLGWRLLYSPITVLEKADVAVVGLNPGGDGQGDGHGEFAMADGLSAYRDEEWKPNYKAGQEPLQRQMLKLFERLGVQPEEALAGNLVPWRSSSWQALNKRSKALEFGIKIWREIFRSVQPSTVVAIGNETSRQVAKLLGVSKLTKVPVGWGIVCGSFGSNGKQRLVCLPHLSRFQIMTRSESQDGLDKLFGKRAKARLCPPFVAE